MAKIEYMLAHKMTIEKDCRWNAQLTVHESNAAATVVAAFGTLNVVGHVGTP